MSAYPHGLPEYHRLLALRRVGRWPLYHSFLARSRALQTENPSGRRTTCASGSAKLDSPPRLFVWKLLPRTRECTTSVQSQAKSRNTPCFHAETPPPRCVRRWVHYYADITHAERALRVRCACVYGAKKASRAVQQPIAHR